jgi:hypothetical protein
MKIKLRGVYALVYFSNFENLAFDSIIADSDPEKPESSVFLSGKNCDYRFRQENFQKTQ